MGSFISIAVRVRGAGMYTEWIEWVEPFLADAVNLDGDPVFCRVKPATAIAAQRYIAMQAKKYDYPTDDEALMDFMIVHWAQKVMYPTD